MRLVVACGATQLLSLKAGAFGAEPGCAAVAFGPSNWRNGRFIRYFRLGAIAICVADGGEVLIPAQAPFFLSIGVANPE